MKDIKLPYKSFLGIKTLKYRIVTDEYAGFECQQWRIYFPIWMEMGFVNTNISIRQAVDYIEIDFKKRSFKQKTIIS